MSAMKHTWDRLHVAGLALVCALPALAEAQAAPQPDAWPAWPAFGWIFPIVCFALMMLVFVLVMRAGMGCMRRRRPADDASSRGSALEILNQRYASGQIDKREYEEKRAAIGLG